MDDMMCGSPAAAGGDVSPASLPAPSLDASSTSATARQYYDWLYTIWMAFLADEETHELQAVLRNLSATMQENERP